MVCSAIKAKEVEANICRIIATPGRLVHLLVEMASDLRSVQFVVYDEADRLFELGFSTALDEILSKLSPNRQTLLFSATLPKSLVEFAKAGLQNPKLVRLDAESKISSDLEMAFLSVKPKEKEAALLILLRDIIGVPLLVQENGDSGDWLDQEERSVGQKRKRDPHDNKKEKAEKSDFNQELAPTQTIVFTATKHHVEYLSLLLCTAGYSVSAIYGTLDQAARRSQLAAFRSGRTQLLVVTDLAARGIDIPILSNVVNYDFPIGSRTFVHRVGRTARAGRKGWAYSFITNSELAHLYDLQLFLSRPLILAPQPPASDDAAVNYSDNLILGTIPREKLDLESDHFRSALLEPSTALIALLAVAEKGQKMYERSQSKASQESHRRAKELTNSGVKGLAGSEREEQGMHPIFVSNNLHSTTPTSEATRANLLAQVNAFRPTETVFEIGSRGKRPANLIMQKRRVSLGKAKTKPAAAGIAEPVNEDASTAHVTDNNEAQADEEELQAVFEYSKPKKQARKDFRDPSVYMGYVQMGADAEKGCALSHFFRKDQ